MAFRYGTAAALLMAGLVHASSITTTPNTSSVTLGASVVTLSDTATLAGGNSPVGTITFTLFYAPSGSIPLDTETAAVNGNGTYSTPTGYTLPTTGTVIGAYQWDASYSGDANNTPVSEVNKPPEQVAVSAASPSLNTTPGGVVLPGGHMQDTAMLSGGYFPMGTLTFLLYGPSSSVVDTETVSVSGNGSYSTPTGFTPASFGQYNWRASYSGDGNNKPVTGSLEGEDIVPEPSSRALLGLVVGGLMLLRRRRAA